MQTQFRHLLDKKDFAALEALWLELITQPGVELNLNHLTQLLKPLANISPEKSALFLSLLAEHLKDNNDYSGLLAVLKQSVSFYQIIGLNATQDRQLRKDIAECYRRLYSNRPNLENFIRKSGLLDNQAINNACILLEQYLAFDVGRYVYSSEIGLGKVTEVDLLLDKITIEFVNGKTLSFTLNQTFKSAITGLNPLPDNDFFLLQHQSLELLKEQAINDPVHLLKSLFKSVKKPLKAKEIKNYLSNVVPLEKWEKFWEKAKKLAMKDANISVTDTVDRSYSYSETAVTKPESINVKNKTSSKDDLDEIKEKISNGSLNDIIEAVNQIKNFNQVKKFILLIREKRVQDWFEIYSKLFFSTKDKRLLNIIVPELLKHSAVSFQQSTLTEVVRSYRSYPHQFLWVLEVPEILRGTASSSSGSLFTTRSLFNRLMDILASFNLQSYWNECRKIITKDDYRFIKSVISELSENEIPSFWNSVKNSANLEEAQKSDIKKIINEFYPECLRHIEEVLQAPNVIYSTADGIKRKQQELTELVTIAIPLSAKEVGRAREFGDLSENYEYKAAKEKQARLMTKANLIRTELKRAKPLDFSKVSTDVVNIGTKVTIQDLSSREIHEYTILGPYDIDPEQKVISYLAPFAQLLLGKKVGDTVIFEPNNESSKTNKIVAINRAR
jgi:transcription elongation GreA/GreB family factor/transcription elongation factor GreA-like protein